LDIAFLEATPMAALPRLGPLDRLLDNSSTYLLNIE
jgi:hypothetical protein